MRFVIPARINFVNIIQNFRLFGGFYEKGRGKEREPEAVTLPISVRNAARCVADTAVVLSYGLRSAVVLSVELRPV
ncbi:hypothetical protein NPIL_341941, partial [Nephila pilipes]